MGDKIKPPPQPVEAKKGRREGGTQQTLLYAVTETSVEAGPVPDGFTAATT